MIEDGGEKRKEKKEEEEKKESNNTSAFKSMIRLIKTSLSFMNFCSFILLRLKSLVRISILSLKLDTSPCESDSLIFSTLKYFFIFFWIS